MFVLVFDLFFIFCEFVGVIILFELSFDGISIVLFFVGEEFEC